MTRTGLSARDADTGPDSAFDASAWERTLGRPLGHAVGLGWRTRVVAAAALLACLAVFLLVRALAATPTLGAGWRTDSEGRLIASAMPLRQGMVDAGVVVGMLDAHGRPLAVAPEMLQRSPRWIVKDADRTQHAKLHARLNQAVRLGPMTLVFADRAPLALKPHARGVAGLGAGFWLMAALAVALFLIAAVVAAARPNERNLLYAIMAACQAANLAFIAVESVPGLLMPQWLLDWDFVGRTSLDLVTSAALIQATGVHPRALRNRFLAAVTGWAVALLLIGWVCTGQLPGAWWWTQCAAIASGLIAIAQLQHARKLEPHPASLLLRRLAMVAVATLALLTLAIATASASTASAHLATAIGSTVWVVFLSSLLAMLPFLSRSQQVLREFSMLAGVSTVATSLDLLFVALFSLGQFASVTLALFISVAIYASVRQWLLNRIMDNTVLTTERAFEQLYRLARQVERQPEHVGERLCQLLRELFEPMEAMLVARHLHAAHVAGDGSTLIVPVPPMPGLEEQPESTVVLRYARKGTRLFCADDATLAERICEQLKRAVAFDQAVEQGRSEERKRLAQDLHDDIGARLLTLMYRASDPETEDYVRHTLKDLKTLTRGLAASNHRLSHAAAEWKADIAQRLNAASCELVWSFSADNDLLLNVVQWSALTRALRELVNNIISHAQASLVEVDVTLHHGNLAITVRDNGVGGPPSHWAHGLGLNGVRKRVRHLGGHVEWQQRSDCGIQCRIVIPSLAAGNHQPESSS